jgi:hypothetical protein
VVTLYLLHPISLCETEITVCPSSYAAASKPRKRALTPIFCCIAAKFRGRFAPLREHDLADRIVS